MKIGVPHLVTSELICGGPQYSMCPQVFAMAFSMAHGIARVFSMGLPGYFPWDCQGIFHGIARVFSMGLSGFFLTISLRQKIFERNLEKFNSQIIHL